MSMSSEPRAVWDAGTVLGEGPVWVERDRALWFTDIKRRQVHRYDPQSGEKRSWDAPEQIGFVFPMESGGFIAGLQSGLYRFDESDGRFELLVEVEPDKPSNRLNDGIVDPSGRLWFGTMDDSEREQSGAFYVYERGQVRPTGLTGIAITNGPAVSPDGLTLYWVDTVRDLVFGAAIRDDASLGPSELLISIPPAEGHADGPTVDCEGCIWISLYAGWEARRYSPAGELIDRVRFPVANITKMAFGGADLRTAYATTARHLLNPADLEAQPLAGALFEFRVDVPGIACPPVAG
jgi:sugar lactone lactonase YvrE